MRGPQLPQEEYPARPLSIPLNYINNLPSRLIKVKQGILPPTLKMIIKTHYQLPARPVPKTSITVQSDNTMGGHRDGENSPQERPRASEEEEKVIANGTPSTEGGAFISRPEVGTDNEATQLADRHFELAILWQQATTAKNTVRGGDYPIQADFGGNPNTATTAQDAAREEAAIGQHRQGKTSTDENKQYDRGRRTADPFISAKWPCCILYALLCVFVFSCFAFLAISNVIIPRIEGSKNYPLKMGAIGTPKP